MPELPEVETIKNDLRGLVVGAGIERAELRDERLVEEPSPEDFVRGLGGVRITGARRRAKHLVVELSSGEALVFQLKIGGQLLLVPPVEEPTRNVMLVLYLDDGRRLFLRDQTEFSRARLLGPEGLEDRLAGLGPEPFSEEFTVGYLRERIGARRAQIKPLLLDQKVVAGIGNIYVDEILFDARIHPRRRASTLSAEEWARLHAAIRRNLAAGIEHRGTTVRLYRDVLGRPGEHQNHLRVFEREGEECPGCGGRVVRERVGGRGTYLCPVCQPEDGGKGDQSLPLEVESREGEG